MRWLALLCALATPVAADEAAIEAAWRAWVADVGATRSSIAITRDGQVVARHGIGMDADAPAAVASLSKAITGACVLSLIEDGAFAYETPLDEVLAGRVDIIGQGGDITVQQLLTHTSGLNYDRTQTLLNPTLWGGRDMHEHFAMLALQRPVGRPDYYYNNENYAVLGTVISEVTGLTVEDACRPRVLMGLETAAPDGRTGGGLAWGGWSISMADYARFAASLNVTDDWPGVPFGGGVYYGPGVYLRDTDIGVNLSHFGGYCIIPPLNHGAYFNVLDNGWGVAVSYNICSNPTQSIALNDTLVAAQRGE